MALPLSMREVVPLVVMQSEAQLAFIAADTEGDLFRRMTS